MALAVGERVLPAKSAPALPLVNFSFGVVSTAPGGAVNSVVWDAGGTSANVPEAALDQVIATDLPGGVGRYAPQFAASSDTPEMIGTIVGAYFRSRNGGGLPQGPYYLLSLISTGELFEAFVSSVTILENR